MSTDTSTTSTTDETPVFEKGTWQYHLQYSVSLHDKSVKARKRASALLWQGAQEGIETWLPTASNDVSAENLQRDLLAALGTARKGDASKIKTVALAVVEHGLVLATFPNLAKAYAEATRLTKTVQQEKDEDDAAEKAVEAIDAPKSTTSVEGAAAILLSKGVDGAVVAILDALNGPSGKNNEAAHRAFLRAVSTEIAARVQAAKPKPVKKAAAGPKDGAKEAGTTTTPKATIKDGKAKAKPAAKKAGAKAKPVAGAKPASAKAKPVNAGVESSSDKGEPVTEPVHAGDEVPDHTEAPAPVAKKAVRRATPVRRKAPASA